MNDRIATYALYTDPPLGRAGMTETEARKSGHNVLVASMAMADVARAIEKGETAGLMKLVVDGDTRKILGAAILGTGGDEAIHCILDLMYAGAPTRCCDAPCTSIRQWRNCCRRSLRNWRR